MSDEVDDRLRHAMATLDDQAPSGYFDTLADRTLARLDGPAALSAVAPLPAPDGGASDPPAFAPGPPTRPRRARLIAAIGAGLAAAAGAVLFISARDRVAEPTAAQRDVVQKLEQYEQSRAIELDRVEATVRNIPQAQGAASGSGASRTDPLSRQLQRIENAPPIGAERPMPATKGTKGDEKPRGKSAGKSLNKLEGNASGTLSLDQPTLGRTQLSSDDIQRGMAAAAARVRACTAGTAGTAGIATLRLSVVPSGRVQNVAVSGPFAGTAVGACVERAVQAATFPAWDGVAQSFDFNYRLSE